MKNVLQIVAILLFLSYFSTQAQTMVKENTSLEALEETVTLLDNRWDLNSTYNIQSLAYQQLIGSGNRNSKNYTWSTFSFKNNELETISGSKIDADLQTFSKLLNEALTAQTGGNASNIKPIRAFIAFLKIKVSDLPLNAGNIKPAKMGEKLSQTALQQTQDFISLAKKIADSKRTDKQKLIAFKYLTCKAISTPWIWNYLDSEFTRVSHQGGSVSDNLVFNRLSLQEVSSMKFTSKIWREAPRFFANQLTTIERPIPKDRPNPKIEFTPKETRVSYLIGAGLRESWVYFDKNSYLVDYDTKKRYKAKSIENGIPLGKTFVVVGCEDKILEITVVYPPVKSSLKSFTLENGSVVPVDPKARMRYLKKTNQMSGGSGVYKSQVYHKNSFMK